MEIRAEDVKALRDRTGAGMMDCKKALTEAGGDPKKAEKILKELGLAAAAKRTGRATNEGRIFTKITGNRAAILELSCETDFVARNEDFVALGRELVAEVAGKGLSADSPALTARVTDLITTIKENMSLRRADSFPLGPGETAVEYIHGEGRIGVLVKAGADKPEILTNPAVKAFIFDCALHVAAFNPQFLSEKDVPAEYLKEQQEIFAKQAENLGKPQNVLQGIVAGKVKKHLAEVCLMDQPFVKDDKKTVAQAAKDAGKAAGGTVSILKYLYFRVGEDLR